MFLGTCLLAALPRQRGCTRSSALCQKKQAEEMNKNLVKATSRCSALGFGWGSGAAKTQCYPFPVRKESRFGNKEWSEHSKQQKVGCFHSPNELPPKPDLSKELMGYTKQTPLPSFSSSDHILE